MRVPPAQRVRFAVPAYAGIEKDTRDSIIEGAKALAAAGIEIDDADGVGGCCYIDYARNALVERFLRGKATDLVFIDSDVGFDPEALVRLCQATRPLVAGVYPKKCDPPQWPVRTPPGEIWSDADGLVACEFAPTGFMRINRAVFGQLTVPMYLAPEFDTPIGAYFQCVVKNGEYIGEDVEFCRRWQRAGGTVYAFADMELRHTGAGRTWRGNWGTWLRSQMPEQEAA